METFIDIIFLMNMYIIGLWMPYVTIGLVVACSNVILAQIIWGNETKNFINFLTWIIFWPLLIVVIIGYLILVTVTWWYDRVITNGK